MERISQPLMNPWESSGHLQPRNVFPPPPAPRTSPAHPSPFGVVFPSQLEVLSSGLCPAELGWGCSGPQATCTRTTSGSAHCWLQPNNAEQDETPPLWSFPANVKGHTGSQTGKGAVQGQEGFTVGAWKNPNGGYHTPST